MLGLLGLESADEQIAEVLIAEHGAVGGQRLPKDLLAMSDEQQRRAAAGGAAESLVVKGRDHRLARARCRDNQVAALALHLPLGSQDVQDLFLERIGPEVEQGERDLTAPPLPRSRRIAVRKRSSARAGKRLEFVVVPVRLERAQDLLPQVRQLVLADLAGPLQAFRQGRVGEIRGADVGTSEAAAAVDDVGLWRAGGYVRCRS